jgi:hypothetical protein
MHCEYCPYYISHFGCETAVLSITGVYSGAKLTNSKDLGCIREVVETIAGFPIGMIVKAVGVSTRVSVEAAIGVLIRIVPIIEICWDLVVHLHDCGNGIAGTEYSVSERMTQAYDSRLAMRLFCFAEAQLEKGLPSQRGNSPQRKR